MISHADEWVPELADDDLDTLVEALEAWEVKDQFGEAMGDLMGSMLTDRNPVARANYERQREQEKREHEQTKRLRKERSVLLRAKLITIRDRRRAERMTRNALSQ